MSDKGKTGLQEVSPGVWAMIFSIIEPEGGGPNGGFIIAGDEVIVVDSFISLGAARELLAHLKNIAGKEPTFLINTHSHADHVLGNQIFSPPATIIAHPNVRETLLRDGRTMIDRVAQTRPALAGEMKEAHIVAPQITCSTQMTLYFGGRTIQLIHPGKAHTPGDIMVYLPEAKVLFAGDLLFNHIVPPIAGDSAGWITAIEQIESMDIQVIVPGHGFVGTKEDIIDLKHFLIHLRQQVKKCYDRKLDKAQAKAEIDLGIYRDWPHQERLAGDIDQLYKEFSA
jgi:cyclase